MRLLVALAVLVVGCAPQISRGEPCVFHSDCDEPYACVDGRCGSECILHADCPPPMFGRCVLVAPEVGRCVVDVADQCGPTMPCPYETLDCVDGHCFNRCAGVDACPADGSCVDGYCVQAPPDAGPGDAG